MKIIDGKKLPTVTDGGVYGFFGQYRFLSNFHVCDILIDGVHYMSSEHAYMAGKTIDPAWRTRIINAKTPSEAKKLGRMVPLRDHWDDYWRDRMMLTALIAKFTIPELKEMLLSTGEKYLEETNDWNDTYWGVCNGIGENQLGKMLMFVRKL